MEETETDEKFCDRGPAVEEAKKYSLYYNKFHHAMALIEAAEERQKSETSVNGHYTLLELVDVGFVVWPE